MAFRVVMAMFFEIPVFFTHLVDTRYNNKQFRYLQYFLYLGIAFLNELNAIPNVDGVADGVKSFQGFMDGVVSRFQVI